MRHVARAELGLLVLVVIAGGICQETAIAATPSSAALPTATGRGFNVAPAGRSDGDGSAGSPWDLATALGHPEAVQPGATIWLRGGACVGTFTSDLTDTAASPIKVRQYPGECATLDAGITPANQMILAVNGAYTWYMGFEVTNSDAVRTTPTPTQIRRTCALSGCLSSAPE
jgi:hypothetical protein